ncbi:hypothetical protein FA15DRAFT_709990 [Coprinopsis marcescibilis]|uniref:Uncharacterized protein n=1 Tax=Coprinopsis marcescibilis TaxID=230819 RepID=A0A5C3KE74_COPMA|nr:hypothetical protein FA15DRAFT_709990 [Coprinopsis marcescibilis]
MTVSTGNEHAAAELQKRSNKHRARQIQRKERRKPQQRYIVVENKLDFSNRAASGPVPNVTPMKSRSGLDRRFLGGGATTTVAGVPAQEIQPTQTTSNFIIPQAPSPLNINRLQAQADAERQAALHAQHHRSRSSAGQREVKG